MECDGIVIVKQCVDRFGEQDDCHQCPDPARDEHSHVKVSDPVHERRIKAERHQQCGKAHAGSDHTQGKAESAEQIPEKVRRDLNGCHLKPDEQCEDNAHAHCERDPGTFCPSLLACFAEQGGQHASDQADEEADRRIRILVEEEGKDICHAKETDDAADEYGDQLRHMSPEIFKRIG